MRGRVTKILPADKAERCVRNFAGHPIPAAIDKTSGQVFYSVSGLHKALGGRTSVPSTDMCVWLPGTRGDHLFTDAEGAHSVMRKVRLSRMKNTAFHTLWRETYGNDAAGVAVDDVMKASETVVLKYNDLRVAPSVITPTAESLRPVTMELADMEDLPLEAKVKRLTDMVLAQEFGRLAEARAQAPAPQAPPPAAKAAKGDPDNLTALIKSFTNEMVRVGRHSGDDWGKCYRLAWHANALAFDMLFNTGVWVEHNRADKGFAEILAENGQTDNFVEFVKSSLAKLAGW